jgi:CRP/FNR family transcriptional regulator, cyclic AMP receptor protein
VGLPEGEAHPVRTALGYIPGVLRRDAKIELLRRIPLFSECSKADLREIARATDEVHVPAGTVMMREGRRGDEAFVVVSGRLEVSRRDSGKVAEIGPGEVVGEMALLSVKPRNATVTAMTPVHALRAEAADFLGLLDRLPLLWLKIARALADRVEDDELLALR